MALKPFALILCLHVAVHHVANSSTSISVPDLVLVVQF
jgi:hypothetical protein